MAVALIGSAASPDLALAGNSLVAPGEHRGLARSTLGVRSDGEWNRLGNTEGKAVEMWTRDGHDLNRVLFFGGVAPGQTLFKDRRAKTSPLPKMPDNMLLTDIPSLLESTYRSQYQVDRMELGTQEAVTISGTRAVRFTYDFVRANDEVERKGEAIGLVKNGRLYLVAYEAPALFYFDRDLPAFRRLAESLHM